MPGEHTPAPWRDLIGTWHVVAGDGGSVCMVNRALRPALEAEANTQLIAAAPDLLEALIDALDLIETITPIEGDTVRKVRAAIAKAKGESE